jgi:hypothetical protein
VMTTSSARAEFETWSAVVRISAAAPSETQSCEPGAGVPTASSASEPEAVFRRHRRTLGHLLGTDHHTRQSSPFRTPASAARCGRRLTRTHAFSRSRGSLRSGVPTRARTKGMPACSCPRRSYRVRPLSVASCFPKGVGPAADDELDSKSGGGRDIRKFLREVKRKCHGVDEITE